MKKILCVILTLLLLVTFAACGTYTPPADNKKPSQNGGGGGNGGGGSGGDTPTVDPDKFSVVVFCKDEGGLPSLDGIYARWTSRNDIHSAAFDENGIAYAEGLDGNYTVTLSAIPDGYTYNPNADNTATNSRKNVEIELLKITPTTGAGDSLYVQNVGPSAIRITHEGTYRTTLTSANHIVYYEYKPETNGKYSIMSWVNVTENEINPVLNYHSGSVGYKSGTPTTVYNDGGPYSTFTKNFNFELQLASDEVDEGQQGNVWTFGIHADVVRGKNYPVVVDFTIKLYDDYERPDESFVPVPVTGNLQSIRPNGTFRYNYQDTANRRLDSSRFVLDPDDGYYHLASDPSKILFAIINKDCELFAPTDSGTGFMDTLIYGRLYFEGKNYMSFIDTYNRYCNADGAHPVTQELREFLQWYADFQKIFMDGNGIGETGLKLQALEEDQWLFCCGYYV